MVQGQGRDVWPGLTEKRGGGDRSWKHTLKKEPNDGDLTRKCFHKKIGRGLGQPNGVAPEIKDGCDCR